MFIYIYVNKNRTGKSDCFCHFIFIPISEYHAWIRSLAEEQCSTHTMLSSGYELSDTTYWGLGDMVGVVSAGYIVV